MKSLQRLLRWWWIFAVAAIVIAITYIYIGIKENSPIHLEVERNTRIDLTPEQILSVRDIGQWEFLTINTEELVEWQRSRTLTTDRLTRIYQGTLRLGIDMSKASDDWFTSLPDSTAQLILPHAALLDNNFIDEARSRSFYEKGSIPPEARDRLYAQARKKMMQRCLTPQNLQTTERNARNEFTRIFKSFGFKTVTIQFK
uniref:DUF4230 domain-containing protein n=1 Tax=Alloprevotella sp. TaxID=1872471 RepID=UPI00402A4C3A